MPGQFYRDGRHALTVPLRLSMVIGILVLFAGCCTGGVNVADIEPLKLDLGPYVEKVTVKNGAGETLYEGSPGQISVDPPLEQLDGTMTITQHWNDGNTRNFTLTHEPNTQVNAGWDSDLGRYVIKKPGPLQIGIAGGFGQVEGTRFGIGTIDKGGREQALARNDDRINTSYVHSHISYELGSKGIFSKSQLYLRTRYQWGEDSESTTEQVGGNTVALTYDRNASNGSTGLGLGATGAQARSENHVKGIDIDLGVTGDIPLGAGFAVAPNINLSYRGFWQTGWGDFRSLTFLNDDVLSETEQDLDDHYYGIGTGAWVTKTFEEPGISVFGGVDLTGYYRDTELKSEQMNRCVVGGCTAANNFTAKVNDDDSGFTYGVVARLGFSVDLSYRYTLGAIARMDYLEERGGVVSRENPQQGVKKIQTEDAFDYTVGVFLRKDF